MMFTGIVKEIGIIKSIGKSGPACKLDVESSAIYEKAGIGDSIAINGACLTVSSRKGDILSFDVMEETLGRTTLNNLSVGDRVNMEPAVRADGSFGGHYVTGHIDCVGRIRDVKKNDDFVMAIEIPGDLAHLVVEKGSVCVDGVSLTVSGIRDDVFKVCVIPHTARATTLGVKKAGDAANIEFDIIGKYCARLLGAAKPPSRISEGFLKDKGFF